MLDADEEASLRDACWASLIEANEKLVIESHCGEDALEKLSRLPHIDLLITDHLMPSMSGPELARAVLNLPSDLPHLEKPFLQDDLAANIARSLSLRA